MTLRPAATRATLQVSPCYRFPWLCELSISAPWWTHAKPVVCDVLLPSHLWGASASHHVPRPLGRQAPTPAHLSAVHRACSLAGAARAVLGPQVSVYRHRLLGRGDLPAHLRRPRLHAGIRPAHPLHILRAERDLGGREQRCVWHLAAQPDTVQGCLAGLVSVSGLCAMCGSWSQRCWRSSIAASGPRQWPSPGLCGHIYSSSPRCLRIHKLNTSPCCGCGAPLQ